MVIFPAVDIKGGKCVRLKQGKEDEVTVFSEDPVTMALYWEEIGAEWLHVVDLDGAFNGELKNIKVIEMICKKINIPMQVGGGIRDVESAKRLFDIGVSRIIVGTIALKNRDLLARMCEEFPNRIGVSLDAENGRLKVKGWVEDSGLYVEDVFKDFKDLGVEVLVYTDILRDGMQSGVNLEAIKKVVDISPLPVIAAGGVKNIEDVKNLYPLAPKGLLGVIVGRALYEGSFNLSEALNWIKKQKK